MIVAVKETELFEPSILSVVHITKGAGFSPSPSPDGLKEIASPCLCGETILQLIRYRNYEQEHLVTVRQ